MTFVSIEQPQQSRWRRRAARSAIVVTATAAAAILLARAMAMASMVATGCPLVASASYPAQQAWRSNHREHRHTDDLAHAP